MGAGISNSNQAFLARIARTELPTALDFEQLVASAFQFGQRIATVTGFVVSLYDLDSIHGFDSCGQLQCAAFSATGEAGVAGRGFAGRSACSKTHSPMRSPWI